MSDATPTPGRMAVPHTVSTLSDREVRRGLQINTVAGCLGMMWFAVAFNMPFMMLLEALGARGIMMGLAGTIRQLATVLQIPGSLVSERLPHRKRLWGTLVIVQRALWFVPVVVALALQTHPAAATIVVAIAAAGAMLDQFAAASWHSWMADLVPERIRGRFWSHRQAFVMIAFLVATAASGRILDLFHTDPTQGALTGFAIVFGGAALLGMADIVIHLWVPEPPQEAIPAGVPLGVRVLAPLKEANFRWLTLSAGAWMFACSLAGTFSVVYLKRAFGASYTDLSSLAICGSLSTVAAGVLWAEVIDRIGARAFGVVMMIVAPFFGLFWFLCTDDVVTLTIPFVGSRPVIHAVLLMATQALVSGGIYAGVGLSHVTLLGGVVPREGRTTAMAVHWTLVGLLGAAGPLVGGVIVDAFAAHPSSLQLLGNTRFDFIHVLAMLHAVVIWTIAMPCLGQVRIASEQTGVAAAFSHLMMVNPLRFVSGLYHVRMVSSAVSRDRRTRAVSALGEKRTAIAVTDLIDRLDDPATEVREAAALSLGQIGSPDAIEALVQKLDDPESDLAPQIARALRQTPSRRSVSALVRRLGDPDRETVRETARTLGVIGDPRASSPLLDLLRTTADDRLATVSGEALAHLGEIAAIYEMLPRMLRTGNAVLRRALAVAIGDLLGEPDGLYRILTEERAVAGSSCAGLVRRLSARIRRLSRRHMQESGPVLIERLTRFQAAYDARRFDQCANELFRLGAALAAFAYGVEHGDDAQAMVEELVWRDQRFAVGFWYLAMLAGALETPPHGDEAHEPPPHVGRMEALLGIYFLTSWSRSLGRKH